MKQAEKPLLIGLTGSIASGKSLAAKWFADHGYYVISSDLIGHEFLSEPEIKEILVDRFGKDIMVSGEIDRKKLGEIIFSDPAERKFLNELLHPLILQRIQKLIDDSSRNVIIIEIPLLFEEKLNDHYDIILNISAEKEIRKKRLKERDELSSVEIENRIASQMTDEVKIAGADITVFNNGSIAELFDKLKEVEKELQKRK